MTIHIKECLPLLDTILIQQQDISERLGNLILTFKREPEPVEPTLRTMLKTLESAINGMSAAVDAHQALTLALTPKPPATP